MAYGRREQHSRGARVRSAILTPASVFIAFHRSVSMLTPASTTSPKSNSLTPIFEALRLRQQAMHLENGRRLPIPIEAATKAQAVGLFLLQNHISSSNHDTSVQTSRRTQVYPETSTTSAVIHVVLDVAYAYMVRPRFIPYNTQRTR